MVHFLSKIIFLFFIFLIGGNANAQKLPKVQQASVRAPKEIKINGRANEWGKFKSYNPANLISYTLANDDDNLYLVISASDRYAIEKISQGGITFTINANKIKDLTDTTAYSLALKYPIVVVGKYLGIGVNARTYQDLKGDTIKYKKVIDSIIMTTNKGFTQAYKEIYVTGKQVNFNPVVSIYNTQGIRVAATFSKKMEYTYELAVPLKHIGTITNKEFSYNIRLNGPPTIEDWVKAGKYPPPTVANNDGSVNFNNQYLYFPTDFWGTYSLAK